MHFLTSLLLLLMTLTFTASLPHTKRQSCSSPIQRRAWHTLSTRERLSYLDAERCLMSRPAQTGAEGAVSRYDDLLGAHQRQAGWIHNTAWFLPWHRLYMRAHERLLREECGYQGAQPYWDEPRDAGRFSGAGIFDAQEGFGGGGDGEEGCIRDGPFADYRLHQGPGYAHEEHCISRAIDDNVSSYIGQDAINECLSQPDFQRAWPCIETNPHTAGHRGVGGVMDNAVSSPGDPLFYLHHTFLDRVWWQWQERDLQRRLGEVTGGVPSFAADGHWVGISLDDEMDVHGVIPSERVRELMDIRGQALCYEYI
ncbi:hypothetical protein DFP73DRAFT_95413 [Morchella snyderi]|nr:hypothetical protein DFP73DRAFT_95413 [Morchella snyderi]